MFSLVCHFSSFCCYRVCVYSDMLKGVCLYVYAYALSFCCSRAGVAGKESTSGMLRPTTISACPRDPSVFDDGALDLSMDLHQR